jgi:TonB family protein
MYYSYMLENENSTLNSGYFLASTLMHVAFFGFLVLLASQSLKEQKKIEIIEIQFTSSPILPPKGIQQEIPAPTAMPSRTSKSKVTNVTKVASEKEKMISEKQVLDEVMSDIPKVVAHQKNVEEPAPELSSLIPASANEADLSSSQFSTDLAENDLKEDLSDIEKHTQVNVKSAAKIKDELEENNRKYLADHEGRLSQEKQNIAAAKDAKIGAARAQANKNINGIIAASYNSYNNESAYGTPSGIRKLEQLRQIPGNKKPEYTIADRRNRLQGDSIYYAYITKKGVPIRFVLSKSTGYESLDERTLAALKNWRFYPGQEGWVELPFSWSLKGGVQEAPSQLRRNLSQK